jgi:hypothetical protein
VTTIAFRNGILAGDGRETIQNDEHSSYYILQDKCRKVLKLRDGRLFGGAHGSESIVRLEEALKKGLPAPKLEDIAGLLIDTKGRIFLYEGNIWQRVKAPYYAVGSGSILAFGAMDAGATAIEAVRIAVRRDPYSGGKVTHVRLRR